MSKTRTSFVCADCGQHVAQWVGRCPGCSGWGTIGERGFVEHRSAGTARLETLGLSADGEPVRSSTGFAGVDRVLGGGLCPGSVTLLAGEPGIGKSTLLLQVVAELSASGLPCVLASGEESRAQVATRAKRIGVDGDIVHFVPGRELPAVLDAARSARPFLLAVDSIQTLRDPEAPQMPGGPAQVRGCTDHLVGLAKSQGTAVLLAGHVTKDGDLAGPRTLEHAVDVVMSFDGDPRSGLRMLSGGKNRFGQEGEVAWFEMTAGGLREIDPAGLLRSGGGEPGAATALPLAGRRALAVEVQALVSPTEGPGRRQVTGLDARRFQLAAAVLDTAGHLPLGRADLFGASLGGIRIDDPACDLAVCAAMASACTGVAAPADAAFVGEVSLTGLVRSAPAFEQRLAAARAAGCSRIFTADSPGRNAGVEIHPVRTVGDALGWALSERPAAAWRDRSA